MDREKIREMAVRVVSDAGGGMIAGLGYIGDRLGLFRALAGAGSLTSDELARRTDLNARYVLEWLKAMVAAQYLECDAEAESFWMTEEAAHVLAEEGGRMFMAGAFQIAVPSLMMTPRVMETFRKGGGIPFSEMDPEIVESIDRIHMGPFLHALAQEWLPQVPGLKAKLEEGISVLDVGCGLGRSTVAIASAYPNSRVVGLEPDPHSLGQAQALAAEAKVTNVTYLPHPIAEVPRDNPYDLIMAIDCIHDMVDPVGALRAIREALSDNGLLFWVEPVGSHNPLENQNPAGKFRSGLSPYHCLSVSLADDGAGLGTLIGEVGARKLAEESGFSRFEKLPIKDPGQQFFGARR